VKHLLIISGSRTAPVPLLGISQDWGYTQLGRPFPDGISLGALAETLDERHFQIDLWKAFGGLLAPFALIAVGCAWQAYMHSICPLWQKLLCWLAVGTGYFGAFQAAADCAHFAFWPQVRVVERA
jgi:fatty acid desaturase